MLFIASYTELKNNVNNNNEMVQVLISRLVQEVNSSWLDPWMDHGKYSIVTPPSAQVWLCHWLYLKVV